MLSELIEQLLEKYSVAVTEEFSLHPVQKLVTDKLPGFLTEILNLDDRYLVEGSVGKGNWAHIPWIAIFDRLVTDTAQDGYYIVYLVKVDCSGIYLSLNQGITTIKNLYGADARQALHIRSSDYLARLESVSSRFIRGPIDLAVKAKGGLGSFYEDGAIASILYSKGSIPNDASLLSDLEELKLLYSELVKKDLLSLPADFEENDEEGLGQEDLTILRQHKRLERNRGLANKVKKIKGYVCEACGFDFEKQYGAIGKNFIEAHHLTPLSSLKGQKVTLNPKTDFSVLCSNCHRMVHKSEFINDINEFRERYIVNPNK